MQVLFFSSRIERKIATAIKDLPKFKRTIATQFGQLANPVCARNTQAAHTQALTQHSDRVDLVKTACYANKLQEQKTVTTVVKVWVERRALRNEEEKNGLFAFCCPNVFRKLNLFFD